MEEVQTYIESGILELYVLGEVSHDERAQVEAMSIAHPSIKAELNEIERSMEAFASEHEVEPAPELRNRILNSLLTNLADDRTFRTKEPVQEARVVPMHPPANANFYKYAFAACLALLLVSTIALFNVYNKLQTANGLVASLSAQNQTMAKTVSFKDEQLTVYRDTAYKIFNLPGTGKTPKASMSLAWSPSSKKVIINMDAVNLPANDAEHQYQLWAIVAGKPVDLGVFDAAKADSATMMKTMKSVDKPQAFAVTLEKRGGVPSPTMANMTVIRMI